MGHTFQGQSEREYAAAVDPAADLVFVDLRSLRVDGEHLALDAMTLEPVAVAPPAAYATEGKHAGMLARAVVLERRRRIPGRPALQLALDRRRLREQRTHGCELLVVGEVRGGRDREIAIVHVVSRTGERDRLQRLGGRPHERHNAGVS